MHALFSFVHLYWHNISAYGYFLICMCMVGMHHYMFQACIIMFQIIEFLKCQILAFRSVPVLNCSLSKTFLSLKILADDSFLRFSQSKKPTRSLHGPLQVRPRSEITLATPQIFCKLNKIIMLFAQTLLSYVPIQVECFNGIVINLKMCLKIERFKCTTLKKNAGFITKMIRLLKSRPQFGRQLY